jgi:hypothetical protein
VGGRVATGRGSRAGEVKGDDPEIRDTCSSRLGVGRGADNPNCKTWICLETSTEASEEEEGWGGHGPKTDRSAIEENEEEVSDTIFVMLFFRDRLRTSADHRWSVDHTLRNTALEL